MRARMLARPPVPLAPQTDCYCSPRCAGHVVPEARLGGPIALVEDGDKITIDSASRTIAWGVDAAEEARRRAAWERAGRGELTVKRGVLYRYARDVTVSGVLSRRFLRWLTVGRGRSRRTWGRIAIEGRHYDGEYARTRWEDAHLRCISRRSQWIARIRYTCV